MTKKKTKKRTNPGHISKRELAEIVRFLKTHPNARILNLEGGGWSIAIQRDGAFIGMIHPRSFLETIVRDKGPGKSEIKKAPSLDAIADRVGQKLLDMQRGNSVS